MMKKTVAAAVFLLTVISLCTAFHAAETEASGRIPIRVLLLPKFEVGSMAGDFPGEAQFYYEDFLTGGEEYEIRYGTDNSTLYVKDGIALCLTGMGKVNAALTTMAVLTDDRFDYSDAYVISTGCAGSSREDTVMGDVFVISAAADYDLGHHADPRDMSAGSSTTWFHDSRFDDDACVILDQDLTERVYELVKDVPLQTTPAARSFMENSFPQAEWAGRNPLVKRGTTVSGDNYWKGEYDHQNAILIVKTYQCPDPYAATEMEDAAVARAMERMGMLDRLIIIRNSVNLDVFMSGSTPESTWAPGEVQPLASKKNEEASDIFPVSMENNYRVGKVIIDAIMEGTL